MKQTDIEERVRQIAWPQPTEDLRRRVLSAAPGVVPRVTWSDRAWYSRPLRIAAAAAVLLTIGLEWLPGSTDGSRFVPTPQALAEAQMIDETVREIGLSADLSATLARRVLVNEARLPGREAQGGLALEGLDNGDRR